jgi:hypothetical protein
MGIADAVEGPMRIDRQLVVATDFPPGARRIVQSDGPEATPRHEVGDPACGIGSTLPRESCGVPCLVRVVS